MTRKKNKDDVKKNEIPTDHYSHKFSVIFQIFKIDPSSDTKSQEISLHENIKYLDYQQYS